MRTHRTITAAVALLTAFCGLASAQYSNVAVNYATGDLVPPIASLGGSAFWSSNPALSDVDASSYNITAVTGIFDAITLGGETRTNWYAETPSPVRPN